MSYWANINDDVAKVVLQNAPYNSSYTSPQIQKDVLHIIASKVPKYICEEIGETKYCIIVDEPCDEFRTEQMAIILRFVDKDGFTQECFFDLVIVKGTTIATLEQEICKVLYFSTLFRYSENSRSRF